MELVEEHRATYGLNQSLQALGLSKGAYYYQRNTQRAEHQGRDAALKERIVSVIEENPSYGYRRIRFELAESSTGRVNHKRIRRVLTDYELGLRRCLPKSRPSPVAKLVRKAGSKADLVKGRSPKALEAFSTDYRARL